MSTPLDQLLATLQTAATQADSALAVADFATTKSPDLARALVIASVPHWFTRESLAVLLDEDLAPSTVELHAALIALPMVEEYPERSAHAVHDQTRLALRDRLWQTDPKGFNELSRRAANVYGTADPDAPDFVLTCEHLYHQLAGQTDAGDSLMALVAGDWRGSFRIEPLQTLARLVEELIASSVAQPPLLPRGIGLAHQAIADARENHQPILFTLAHLQQAEAIFRELSASDPANTAWQRDLSVSLDSLGDLAMAQGDLTGAIRNFTERKTIADRLAASDPTNATLQYDLGLSNERLGDLAVEQGKLDEALVFQTRRKDIISALAASDPANTAWQRDLSVSLNKLGSLAMAQGKLAGALHYFTESKSIAERLAASDPANAAWQYDLGISNERLGDLAVQQGKLDEALVFQTKRKDIISALAASDPANASWQRDLSVALNKLGDLAVAQDDLDGAFRHYTESKSIAERLAASDPANAARQMDVASSLNRLGVLVGRQGQVEEQLRCCDLALDIVRRLAASEPANATWQTASAGYLFNTVMAAARVGKKDGAMERLNEAYSILWHLDISGRLPPAGPGRDLLNQLKEMRGEVGTAS